MERRNFLRTTGALGTGGLIALAGCADDAEDDADPDAFPTDDLTWMIPWGEGGGTDTYARQLQGTFEEEIGASVTIDNREGAGSMVGTEWLTTRDADGYTLGTVNSAGAHFTWRAAEIDDWHIEEDLEPVAYSGVFGYTIIVNNDVADEHGIDDFASLRDAYQDEDIETFGYQGAGSDSHLLMLLLRDGYDMAYNNGVPYDGGGPTMEAVISGEVSAGFATNTSAVNAEESGEATAIVNTMDIDLSDTWPDIDRIDNYGDSLGWLSEFTLTQHVPVGTPTEVKEQLSAAIEVAANSDSVQEWSEDTGNIVQYGDMEEAEDLWFGIVDEMEEQVEAAIDGGFDGFLALAEEEG
ncbi:Bug family tripartite tricarboxylate transporter substrate binding protein [Halorubrum vacuolatum]|nr:tripartite tricarboxylate transporter substrate-binding protein [Halorubrum vacuolatum]